MLKIPNYFGSKGVTRSLGIQYQIMYTERLAVQYLVTSVLSLMKLFGLILVNGSVGSNEKKGVRAIKAARFQKPVEAKERVITIEVHRGERIFIEYRGKGLHFERKNER